jgi:hypothetical protein
VTSRRSWQTLCNLITLCASNREKISTLNSCGSSSSRVCCPARPSCRSLLLLLLQATSFLVETCFLSHWPPPYRGSRVPIIIISQLVCYYVHTAESPTSKPLTLSIKTLNCSTLYLFHSFQKRCEHRIASPRVSTHSPCVFRSEADAARDVPHRRRILTCLASIVLPETRIRRELSQLAPTPRLRSSRPRNPSSAGRATPDLSGNQLHNPTLRAK